MNYTLSRLEFAPPTLILVIGASNNFNVKTGYYMNIK
jgi:hypothetical protein